MTDPMTVTVKFYNNLIHKLVRDEKFLEILHSHGVENWDWYGGSPPGI